MSTNLESTITLERPTLAFAGSRAVIFQMIMIAAAVVLPAAAHLAGLPVRMLLPMHWPVILAGLVYGWRAGGLTGLLAPAVNYLLTGYPLPNIIPSMTVELLTYGLTAGFLRESLRLGPYLSTAVAVVIGRCIFALSVLYWNVYAVDLSGYFKAALIPGIAAALLQIFLLPFVAKRWITQERRHSRP